MKTMKIKIKSREDADRELREVGEALQKGKAVKKKDGFYFESIDAVRAVLTNNRLDVWRAIRDKKPKSISELAKLLDRDFRVVHGDVSLLVEVGIVKLKKGKSARGDTQAPVSMADRLILDVA